MRNYLKKRKTIDVLESITCDVCKETFTDDLDVQEMIMIDNIAGYGSVFGDGNMVQLDMCQDCFRRLCGKYIRVEDADGRTFS
jgi:hypothetical protein